MKNQKIILGQFFTRQNVWLKNQIKNFILTSNCKIAYDPFAGRGGLSKKNKNLHLVQKISFVQKYVLQTNKNNKTFIIDEKNYVN